MNVMRQKREREERRERAVAPGRGFLYATTLAAVPHLRRPSRLKQKGPLTQAFSANNLSVNNMRSFSRAAV
jgi:hypothetical protein